jgi:hypothetical protein
MPTNEIAHQIRAAVAAVTSQHEFLKWLKEEKIGDGLSSTEQFIHFPAEARND